MTIPLTILAILIILLVVVIILSPFLQPDNEEGLTELEGQRQQLESERFSALTLLRDLELDYTTGKLSQEDYQRLKGRYSAQAVAVLQALDQLPPPDTLPQENGAPAADPELEGFAAQLSAELEREIAALRTQTAAKPAGVAAHPNGAICPACGTPVKAGDRFCARCGTSLALGPVTCAHCGTEMKAEDRFCAKCGRAR